jgi:hypothetical protein
LDYFRTGEVIDSARTRLETVMWSDRARPRCSLFEEIKAGFRARLRFLEG